MGADSEEVAGQGARRRHVGALLANGVLGSIFGDLGQKREDCLDSNLVETFMQKE